MNLTTKQVADKLNVSTHTVRVWGNQGKFKFVVTGNGKKKQHRLYDSKSVNEFKATFSPKRTKVSNETPTNGIFTRLESIEAKLDKLIKMWS